MDIYTQDLKYLNVMAGQSNAQPDLASALAAAGEAAGHPAFTLRQKNHGGKGLKFWINADGSAASYFLEDFFSEHETAYLQTVLANPVLARLPIVLHWFQGESNADHDMDSPEFFAAHFGEFLDLFAGGCAAAGRRWYGVLYKVWNTATGPSAGYTTVRAAIQAQGDQRDNCIVVETQGYGRPDSVHIATGELPTLAANVVAALSNFLPYR